MSKKTGARKCDKQTVICSSPTVNKTQIGNTVVPIPYPIMFKLDQSKEVSSNVFFNGSEAFTMASNSSEVKGDAVGDKKGIKSGTVSAKAEPTESSGSVRVNKKKVIRCGDVFDMNDGNTKGTLVCSPPANKTKITDNGKVDSCEEST